MSDLTRNTPGGIRLDRHAEGQGEYISNSMLSRLPTCLRNKDTEEWPKTGYFSGGTGSHARCTHEVVGAQSGCEMCHCHISSTAASDDDSLKLSILQGGISEREERQDLASERAGLHRQGKPDNLWPGTRSALHRFRIPVSSIPLPCLAGADNVSRFVALPRENSVLARRHKFPQSGICILRCGSPKFTRKIPETRHWVLSANDMLADDAPFHFPHLASEGRICRAQREWKSSSPACSCSAAVSGSERHWPGSKQLDVLAAIRATHRRLQKPVVRRWQTDRGRDRGRIGGNGHHAVQRSPAFNRPYADGAAIHQQQRRAGPADGSLSMLSHRGSAANFRTASIIANFTLRYLIQS
ncbi:uncharacterized protein MYCFIDRAFT_174806 [Pseudocercospora fijiensis CIRAD86]|uniref:Uncharacterized protein n=1 Tax=Pseudocercospora fijiensis (strain CIRAD86) TaxID=383855 RepID=M2Z0I5_PSEFD|nr:uncharacterized protein MYCFIDRAFT_174806 [Pseudocercospora fijiensis CIRAD86]EME83350.1 hypothetical protein MYCFIDRAFT_174806 [Pseudocercospora fijiensis CIRAD86]